MSDADQLRIGTAERESAVKLLSEHMSEGRLSLEEYEERMAVVLEARTRADLKPLFTDLPPPYPPFMNVPALPPPSGPPMYTPHAQPPALPGQSDRYRVAAGVLQIMLPFGIGRFYTGHNGIAIAQLVTSLVGVGIIWSIIDGIIMLASGGTDAEGRPLRM
ncbi:DUF1707 domain-containing protein [Actinophytocola oryzae]|uniref:TM2 domain-containing protein n=1 Tax=Actinophytocola oryzae TaxID=502181 RepID=A0A4R7US20_9PSEU|nr:DUF1707 domain-containing protein [Actinophytocola oryzae]TDV36647.1 TM2 domain-containing protein [Actinophytocola oryzae]